MELDPITGKPLTCVQLLGIMGTAKGEKPWHLKPGMALLNWRKLLLDNGMTS